MHEGGRQMVDWRLGIDLGTNSLGWAALKVIPDGERWAAVGIIDAGARIFSDGRDPKSGASLAVDRRDARAMRRRRDRFQQRQRALMGHLVGDGLFPADPAERRALERLDPYELRARGLDAELTLPELGRAIWHLNQRRGFKSNRKADKPDDESGKIKTGVGRLREQMQADGARTYGEWLQRRRLDRTPDHPDGLSVRTRLRPEQGEDAKGTGYDFYPGRDLLEEEFNELLDRQAAHHPDVLTAAVRARLFEIVFHQRPLKRPLVGTCTFGGDEERLAKAHPLFQRRRLLEEVNALKVVRTGEVAERLTPEERDAILLIKPDSKAKISFDKMRKALRLDPEARFNKESDNRDAILADEVAMAMGTPKRFGTRWASLSTDEQWEVVRRLEEVESDAELDAFRAWVADRFGVSDETAKAISAARLPQGHGRFGETMTRALIGSLSHDRDPQGRVIVYSEAVERLGKHHSDFRTGEVLKELPPYPEVLDRHVMPGSGDASETDMFKRVGRLTNPTVHIGLNQLRRTVNKLIARYGPPAEIAIELARDLKLTDDEKKRRNRENNENRLAAERRSAKLRELGVADNGANRARLKLWEELDGNAIGRHCVYSGRVISPSMLFTPEVEIDHILPFSATLDDSNANKIVCVQEANRHKRKQSPWQAWGGTAKWDEIVTRAARLPRNKQWRFEPDALDRFKEQPGFLPRQLVDTQYLSRLAREYLASLYPDQGEGSGKVWVSPGKLTEMVRRKLGLNDLLPDHNYAGGADQPKNRLDHRHHAIDAIVIGIVDRSMLQKIARESGLEGAEGRERIMVPAPWDGFRDDVAAAVRSIVVSHRADHGTARHGAGSTAGRLHNDTAYGFTGLKDSRGNTIVVRRKPLAGLKPADLPNVRDPDLRLALHRAGDGLEGKALERALADFPRTGPLPFRGTRRVRVTEPLTVIPIRNRAGHAYKGYKGDSNYRYDVWEMPDGKWVTHWRDREGMERCGIVSMFDAHQAGEPARPHPAARKVLSLHQDDLLLVEPDGGERRLMRVVKFGQSGQITLAAPNEAGDLKRRDAASNEDDPFKYIAPTAGGLKKARARQVRIDEIGRVRDPGFPARTAVRRTRPRLEAAE